MKTPEKNTEVDDTQPQYDEMDPNSLQISISRLKVKPQNKNASPLPIKIHNQELEQDYN